MGLICRGLIITTPARWGCGPVSRHSRKGYSRKKASAEHVARKLGPRGWARSKLCGMHRTRGAQSDVHDLGQIVPRYEMRRGSADARIAHAELKGGVTPGTRILLKTSFQSFPVTAKIARFSLSENEIGGFARESVNTRFQTLLATMSTNLLKRARADQACSTRSLARCARYASVFAQSRSFKNNELENFQFAKIGSRFYPTNCVAFAEFTRARRY